MRHTSYIFDRAMMKRLRAALLLLCACLPLAAQSSNPIQYFYDDLGRLTKVVDQNGNVATYSYDAAGNITSIQRSTVSVNAPAIFSFAPQSGPIGQTVTIQGQGFSATPTSNTVQFNGTGASVMTASATSLTVTVPYGSQSGPIVVSVNNQSVTSDTSFTVTAGTLSSITVSPTGLYLPGSGQQQQFTATGMFANGTSQDITASATWSSLNPPVAAVSNTTGSRGLATIAGSGVATITATSGSVSGSATLTVVGSLTLSPGNESVPKAVQQQFTATAVIGTSQNVTQTVTWSSSNSAVATISNLVGSQGLVNDTGVGTTTITASLGSVSASTPLTLTSPVPTSLAIVPATTSLQVGNTLAFTATATLTDGTTQSVTQTATWSTSDSAVVTVSNAAGSQGLVSAAGPGTATVTATLGSVTNTATVIVGNNNESVFPRFLYGLGNQISVYAINATTGQPRKNLLVPTSVQATASVFNPSQTFLYVAGSIESGSSGAVAVFSVNASNGNLTEIAGSPFPTGLSPVAVAINPAGTFLYVANRNGNSVSAFSINQATGALTGLSASPFATEGQPYALLMHPSGKFLFVTNYSSNVQGSVSVFAIDAGTGVLTEISGSPFPVGYNPVALAGNPAGNFVYVANSGQNFGSSLPPSNWPGRINAMQQVATGGGVGSSVLPAGASNTVVFRAAKKLFGTSVCAL